MTNGMYMQYITSKSKRFKLFRNSSCILWVFLDIWHFPCIECWLGIRNTELLYQLRHVLSTRSPSKPVTIHSLQPFSQSQCDRQPFSQSQCDIQPFNQSKFDMQMAGLMTPHLDTISCSCDGYRCR